MELTALYRTPVNQSTPWGPRAAGADDVGDRVGRLGIVQLVPPAAYRVLLRVQDEARVRRRVLDSHGPSRVIKFPPPLARAHIYTIIAVIEDVPMEVSWTKQSCSTLRRAPLCFCVQAVRNPSVRVDCPSESVVMSVPPGDTGLSHRWCTDERGRVERAGSRTTKV